MSIITSAVLILFFAAMIFKPQWFVMAGDENMRKHLVRVMRVVGIIGLTCDVAGMVLVLMGLVE